MKNLIYTSFFLLLIGTTSYAQNVGIGINAPDASAKLDIESTDKGLLIPRLSLSATNVAAPVATPATSLLVYNNATAGAGATAVTPGFYYWDGVQWVRLETGGTHNTLDMAYDEGGPGAGRIIAADAGAVEINGTGGLIVDANTATVSTAATVNNTDGTNISNVEIGFVGQSGANTQVQGIRSISRGTQATNIYDGIYGVLGNARHPSGGTINLNGTIGSVNKAIGTAGSIGSTTSFTGSEQDIIAGIHGGTGLHNSSGGTVTGAKLYAGLFSGNGRTVGLWGENSTYIELLPRWQVRDYDAGVIGFYNSAANGGNNGGSIGSGDNYLSIEANVTDATSKDVVLQARTNGDVGINTSGPTANLSVNGTANKTGGGTWAVFSDKRLKESISDYTEGLDLITKIRTVNFSYNDKMEKVWGASPDTKGRIYQGVIAQELQKIAPDMVREVTVSDETYLEVDPNKFIYSLINAVQEQQAQIEDLKKEVEELRKEK